MQRYVASFEERIGIFLGLERLKRGQSQCPWSAGIRMGGSCPREWEQRGKGSKQWCLLRCMLGDRPSHRPGTGPSRVVFPLLAGNISLKSWWRQSGLLLPKSPLPPDSLLKIPPSEPYLGCRIHGDAVAWASESWLQSQDATCELASRCPCPTALRLRDLICQMGMGYLRRRAGMKMQGKQAIV